MNKAYIEELTGFCKNTELRFLKDKSVMITGASGLIGSYLVDAIMMSNIILNNSIIFYHYHYFYVLF